MLFMAGSHVAENPYHADCLRLIRKLHPIDVATQRVAQTDEDERKMFQEIITTLEQQGDVVLVAGATQGRPSRGYRLVRDWSVA